jgi:hypothetical protein
VTGGRFLLALAVLPLLGLPAARRLVPGLSAWAALGVAGVFGALVVCLGTWILSIAGISWSVPLIIALALFPALTPRRRTKKESGLIPEGQGSPAAAIAVFLVLAVVTYAAATTRATAADLLLFWGAKGQRFAQARAIDVEFLREPMHQLMHPDYPPMLTSLYAWGALAAGRFAWGAATLTLPLFLALALAAFYGLAERAIGRRVAAEHTALLAAVLGFLSVRNLTAGNADMLLTYFEVVALSALVFAGDDDEGRIVAAVALTGAVLTKVEGTVFAALLVGAFILFGMSRGLRRVQGAVSLALPPFLAFAAWLAYCRFHGLLDIYGPRPGPTTAHVPAILRQILHEASFASAYAPWIVFLVLLVWGAKSRAAAVPLVCGAGFLAFLVYMYATSQVDPWLWVFWSAARLLVTPLVCLAVASAAACPRRA